MAHFTHYNSEWLSLSVVTKQRMEFVADEFVRLSLEIRPKIEWNCQKYINKHRQQESLKRQYAVNVTGTGF